MFMSRIEHPAVLRCKNGDDFDIDTGRIDDHTVKNRAFDTESFHRLMLERLDSQRKAEKERGLRHVLIRTPSVRLDVGPAFASRSPSSVAEIPLSTDISQLQIPRDMQASFRAFISAKGMHDKCNATNARQELLRLGRRYASSHSHETRSMTTHTDSSSSLDLTRPFEGNVDKICDDRTMHATKIDDQRSSIESIGAHGIYLLLARTNSAPNQDPNDTNLFDDEDGSASESYSTPTRQLQSSLDDDECYDLQNEKLDHFTSLCAAQVLLSNMENKASKPKGTSINLGESEEDEFLQHQRQKRIDRRKQYFNKVFTIVLAGIAIFFCWRCALVGYRRKHLHLRFDSKVISVPFNTYLHLMQRKYWSMKLRFENRVGQLISFRQHFLTPHSISWTSWRNTVSIFTEWRRDIDWFSCIIKSIYRLQKVYRDAIMIACATKLRILRACQFALTIANAAHPTMLDAQRAPMDVWNATVTFAMSLRRNSMSEQQLTKTSHRFASHHCARSSLTSPVLFLSDDYDVSVFGRNGTTWLYDETDVGKSPLIEYRYWRKAIKLPFLRNRLPVIRQNYLHSLPSFEAVRGSSDPFSSSLTWPSDPNKRGYSYPLILRSRPRLALANPRLDSIALSLDIQQNMAVSLIMQKTRPPKQCDQAIAATVKRDYYESSYPLDGQSEGKNVFEDVDIMNMVHEFVEKVMQRRSWLN
jgi:hypothetical protein